MCHHQNDSCLKKGSDESRFNVSFIVSVKTGSTGEETGEPGKAAESNRGPNFCSRPHVLPLGQTGSQTSLVTLKCCFTSTETVGLLGTGAQDVHLDSHTAPELRHYIARAFK